MSAKEKTEGSFESRLARLEELAESIRSGSVPLEEAAHQFEEGMKLAQGLERDLSKIERRVDILVNQPAEGEKPVLELFPELGEIAEK